MKAPGLPADQQFFADLFSGLVLNPQLLGRVWFASQPTSLPVGSLCIDFPRLDIVLRGEYGNLLEAKQQRMVEGEMLFIPARAAIFSITAFVTGFRIIMPSRSPARAWLSFLISRPIICQNCLLSMEQCVLSSMFAGYEWQRQG